jgi:hypothetical protein
MGKIAFKETIREDKESLTFVRIYELSVALGIRNFQLVPFCHAH